MGMLAAAAPTWIASYVGELEPGGHPCHPSPTCNARVPAEGPHIKNRGESRGVRKVIKLNLYIFETSITQMQSLVFHFHLRKEHGRFLFSKGWKTG